MAKIVQIHNWGQRLLPGWVQEIICPNFMHTFLIYALLASVSTLTPILESWKYNLRISKSSSISLAIFSA